MSLKHNNISNSFALGLAFTVCIVVVIFETSQQYFYIKLYQLNATATYQDLLFGQTRKWLVWIAFAIPLWFYSKRLIAHEIISTRLIANTVLMILLLLLAVITTMSFIEIMLSDSSLRSLTAWQEYFIFYVFQKTPIYLFGYTLLTLIFYLYLKNNQLTVQILKLSELTPKDLNEFYQHKASQDSNTEVLKIKVGNSYKIISVDDVDWIEADDYCVNIHYKNNQATYSMRTSLKSLEKILPVNFLRVHRSAIVNMNCVSEYKTQGGGMVKMQNGEEVAVAQSKIKQLNEYYSLRE